METLETIVNKKIEELVEKGADDFSIDKYLIQSFELAMVRLLSNKIDKLSDEQYQKIEQSVNERNFNDLNSILGNDKLSQKLDEKIFEQHVKDVFKL
jgi:hypothetical protein